MLRTMGDASSEPQSPARPVLLGYCLPALMVLAPLSQGSGAHQHQVGGLRCICTHLWLPCAVCRMSGKLRHAWLPQSPRWRGQLSMEPQGGQTPVRGWHSAPRLLPSGPWSSCILNLRTKSLHQKFISRMKTECNE